MKTIKEILKEADNKIAGIPAAPGLVVANAYLFSKEKLEVNHSVIENADEAIVNLHEALEKSKKELNKIFGIAKQKMEDTRAAIFEAHVMILDDPILVGNIEKRIRAEKISPEYIVDDEISKYQNRMNISNESYMKERAADIEDIKNRIVRNLQKKRWQSKITTETIVVSSNLTPSDTILFSRSDVKAFVVDHGGLTSHAAIIARSLDIPAVVGTHSATKRIKDGDLLVVDGYHGVIFINPTKEQLEFFTGKIKKLESLKTELKEINDRPSKTLDGKEIKIKANVDVTGEIDLVVANKAKGIGLYRTEQLLNELGEIPNEEEQTKIYSDLSGRIYPELLTIRAFDIGGDKINPLEILEANPFLGLRGVRFLLENESMFRTQIRAVLRASQNKNVQFMIPMISTFAEIRRCKKIIEECKAELRKEKVNFDNHLKVGIMVEVPAAAVMAKEFAAEVDFFSIGTNDLIQYLIAVDRGNDVVSGLYQEFHPAVIRTISHIVKEGKKSKITINICGEMAADTLAIPLLVGLGLDSLSVSPTTIPYLRRIISEISYAKAKQLAEECLLLTSEKEITEHVEKFFKENTIKRSRNYI
jgi:phosphoenolpyruvate-protein phosphotransferase (PTS system enzyme I)